MCTIAKADTRAYKIRNSISTHGKTDLIHGLQSLIHFLSLNIVFNEREIYQHTHYLTIYVYINANGQE